MRGRVAALAVLVLSGAARADNPGSISGIHGHSDRAVSLSGGWEYRGWARLFMFAQIGSLLGPAAQSPLVKSRRTYLLGVGISVAVL